MLSNEPTLRPGLFRLPDDPVASSVLIPGFRAATRVRGAFGWFTAGWIGRLAPGLAVYLNRADGKPIEFTVAPALFPDERSTVQRGVELTPREAAELVVEVFVNGRVEATALARHALDCLAWMLATDRLVELANRLAGAGCPIVLRKLSENALRTTPLDRAVELARTLRDDVQPE